MSIWTSCSSFHFSSHPGCEIQSCTVIYCLCCCCCIEHILKVFECNLCQCCKNRHDYFSNIQAENNQQPLQNWCNTSAADICEYHLICRYADVSQVETGADVWLMNQRISSYIFRKRIWPFNASGQYKIFKKFLLHSKEYGCICLWNSNFEVKRCCVSSISPWTVCRGCRVRCRSRTQGWSVPPGWICPQLPPLFQLPWPWLRPLSCGLWRSRTP